MDKQAHKNTKESIIKQISQFIPQWKQVSVEQAQLRRMAGITNETYKVSHPKLQALIYRQFGDASDNLFLNRHIQEFVYKFLSQEGVGPKIYGMKQDVRIQQFIQSNVIKTKQMLEPDYVQNVAYALRKFHKLNPNSQTQSPLPEHSLFNQTFFAGNSPILAKCIKKMGKNIFNEDQQSMLQQLRKWITQQQIQYIRQLSKKLQKRPLVFSHNDLLAGNILIRQKDKKIIFIDYEYSCYNYIVYDIANYFNQAIYDYETKDPPFYRVIKLSKEQQNMKDYFIRCYILAGRLQYPQYKEYLGGITQLSRFAQGQVEHLNFNQQETGLYHHIRDNLIIGLMLSHLMWGWWAIIVSKNLQINFDYISFSMNRYKLYQECKQQIQAKNKTQDQGHHMHGEHKHHQQNQRGHHKKQQKIKQSGKDH